MTVCFLGFEKRYLKRIESLERKLSRLSIQDFEVLEKSIRKSRVCCFNRKLWTCSSGSRKNMLYLFIGLGLIGGSSLGIHEKKGSKVLFGFLIACGILLTCVRTCLLFEESLRPRCHPFEKSSRLVKMEKILQGKRKADSELKLDQENSRIGIELFYLVLFDGTRELTLSYLPIEDLPLRQAILQKNPSPFLEVVLQTPSI